MPLHHALRDLVGRLGPGILGDADALLGSLDDYVDDADADPAALAILADGVREGALLRLVELLDNGATPAAAVEDAGAALAARRGTDGRGARWVVAALGHAAGRLDESVAAAAHADWQAGLRTRPEVPPPPPPPTPEPTPEPTPRPAPPPAPRPAPDLTNRVANTAVHGESAGVSTAREDGGVESSRRILPVALVVLLLAAVGAAAWLVLGPFSADRGDRGDRGDPAAGGTDGATTASTGPSSSSTGEEKGDSGASPAEDAATSSSSRGFVAYASRSGGTSEVEVIDLTTGTTRPVAADGNASQPSASADGRTVAFILEDADGKHVAISRGTGAPLLLDVGRSPSDPAISPDGSAVAYVTATDHGKDVSVRQLSGTTATVVAGGSADEFAPAWSADGSRLAYVLTGSSDDTIVVVDSATGNELSRTVASGHVSSPSLSPSGDRVAYVATVQGNAEVVVSDLGATSSTADSLSQSGETETGVLWLPDGRLVTAVLGRGLVVVSTTSSATEALTSGAGDSL